MSPSRVLVALALTASLGACQSGRPESKPAAHDAQPAYFVIGAVEHEGPRALEEDLTVWDAVMRSAPLEAVCDLRRVHVLRLDEESPQVIEVDLDLMGERADSTFNVLVAGGDVIYVPRRNDD